MQSLFGSVLFSVRHLSCDKRGVAPGVPSVLGRAPTCFCQRMPISQLSGLFGLCQTLLTPFWVGLMCSVNGSNLLLTVYFGVTCELRIATADRRQFVRWNHKKSFARNLSDLEITLTGPNMTFASRTLENCASAWLRGCETPCLSELLDCLY